METFVVNIASGEYVDVTRDKVYEVTFIPKESVTKKELSKTGRVLGLSIANTFLRLKETSNSVEYSIPVNEIIKITESK